jgi:heme oxygenase (biliverdin-IX-beta and delta-forming)
MDLKLLRSATRPEHEATEELVPLMHPDLTRAEYAAVLQRFHGVIQAWEAIAAAEAPATYADLVRQRTRCKALEADLDFLEAPYGSDVAEPLVQQMQDLLGDPQTEEAERTSRFLGAMYVVEGSTLGGQYIASHVETALGLESGQGSRFFRGYGAETVPKWREFQQALLAVPDAEGHHTITAAKGMFGVFSRQLSTGFLPDPNPFAQDKNDGSGRLQPGPVRAS